MRSKGEIEAAVSEAMVRFEMDFMGRGPKEARSHIIDDLILVRLKGVLTPAEQQLAKCADGMDLIKKMRSTLIENARGELARIISQTSGANVLDIFTDINTASGDRIFVFVLDAHLAKDIQRKFNT